MQEGLDAIPRADPEPVRPELERMISQMSSGPRFALPGALCAPVFDACARDSKAMRVLMAMIWISASTLKEGRRAIFQAPVSDLRHAAGLSSYRANKPVIRALDCLRAEACVFQDGVEIAVFDAIDRLKVDGVDMVRWTFDEDFASIFVHPRSFALLDIRKLVCLSTSLDVFLYCQGMLVRKMRRPEFEVPAEDMRRLADLPSDVPLKRAMERVRRSLVRVVALGDFEIDVRPVFERGRRAIEAVRFAASMSDD